MDVLMSILAKSITTPWPVYCAVVLAVAWIAWLVGRGGLRDERQLRRHVEDDARVGGFAIGRAEVQTAQLDALTVAIAPRDLPPRAGIVLPDLTLTMPTVAQQDATALAADFPPEPSPAELDEFDQALREDARHDPALGELLETVDALAADVHAQPAQRLDLDGMFEVEPDDVEPDDDDQPPVSGSGTGEPTSVESVAPRYRPETPVEPRPANRGVLPASWMLSIRWRLRTWWVWLRHEAASLRQMEARGFAPGEATELVRSGPPLPPLPGSKAARRRHLARRGAESWADRRSALSARWYAERQEATESLRRLLQPPSESGWSQVLPEMRSALAPQRRTVVPSLPFARSIP